MGSDFGGDGVEVADDGVGELHRKLETSGRVDGMGITNQLVVGR